MLKKKEGKHNLSYVLNVLCSHHLISPTFSTLFQNLDFQNLFAAQHFQLSLINDHFCKVMVVLAS